MKQKVLYKAQILSSNLENVFHVIISKLIGFIEVQNIIQYDSINKKHFVKPKNLIFSSPS